MTVEIIHGDSRAALEFMPSNSIHSVVTDPPYALVSISKRFSKSGRTDATASKSDAHQRFARGFMGKTWDNGSTAFDPAFWEEVWRVLRPGGHVLAFGGTRTYHRLASAIEDAGFEIRDQIGWLYGSGFPKSHNQDGEWQGWGTALKPAWEPIVVARKALDGTNAQNLARWGVGALNIDGCRVGWPGGAVPQIGTPEWGGPNKKSTAVPGQDGDTVERVGPSELGRWPANVIHDGSDEVLDAFPSAKGQQGYVGPEHGDKLSINTYGDFGARPPTPPRGDSGSAARFFKQVNWEDAEWLAHYVQLHDALTAGPTLSLQKLSDGIAQSDAATLALPAGTQLSVSKAPSTSVTLSESKLFAASVITAILTIGPRFLRDWQHERLSPKDSPVSIAAHRTPTGTIEIIAGLLKSDGSAVSATFSITPQNSEVGAAGSALSTARFMYAAKASKADRNDGLDDFVARNDPAHRKTNIETTGENPYLRGATERKNTHPTVKPTPLMQYLTRLVTPPGGTVLDPFMGSGSTGRGAVLEGFNFIGCEMEAEYAAIAKARIAAVQPKLEGVFA